MVGHEEPETSWDFIADLMNVYSDSMGYEWDINGI